MSASPAASRLSIGQVVRINQQASKYCGVIGVIYEIQESSGYAMVDMPLGTEMRIERIQVNAIVAGMRAAEKDRKKPRERWPAGDPQWFPMRWLLPKHESGAPL